MEPWRHLKRSGLRKNLRVGGSPYVWLILMLPISPNEQGQFPGPTNKVNHHGSILIRTDSYPAASEEPLELFW